MSESQSGIWQWAETFPIKIKPEFQVSLGEGNTPLEEIGGIFFKREDLNPSGSIKDRGLAFQISYGWQAGHKEFVIASSGNAAISAARLCHTAGLKLRIYLSTKVDQEKLSTLRKIQTEDVFLVDLPVQNAHRYAKQAGAYDLRPSMDPYGTVGFQTIAYELIKQLKTAATITIFTPVSSGTHLVGLIDGFKQMNHNARFFAVQTSVTHGVADQYDQNFQQEETSLASGLVARSLPRKKQLVELLGTTNGGWVVTNEQISSAYAWLGEKDLNVSYDSAVSLAGLRKSMSLGWRMVQPTVCILTGAERH